jgi:hypothetical protein
MAMAPTTESEAPTSDLGHRFFLLGIFAILVAEVVVTLVNVGQWFQWSSCLLGIVAGLGILYLGNWLYTGDKGALKVTQFWVLLQLALVLIAVIITVTGAPPDSTIPGHLGINAMWQAYLKLAVYLGFAYLLFVPGATLDFFASQRGETLTKAPLVATEQTAAAGAPVDLAPEHVKALDGLFGAMKMASGILVTVGVLQILTGLLAAREYLPGAQQQAADEGQAPLQLILDSQASGPARDLAVGLLGILNGALLAALGAVLLAPAKALQTLMGASPRNTGFVMNFLTTLLGTFKAYLAILLVLIILVVVRIAINAM